MIRVRITDRPGFYRAYLAHRAYLRAFLGGLIFSLFIVWVLVEFSG